MGYKTKFDLSIDVGEYDTNDVVRYMKKNNRKNESFYPFMDTISDNLSKDKKGKVHLKTDETYKWYEHEEEMKELSKVFPEAVFSLHGVGEEFPDIWNKYFKDGKMQKCDSIIRTKSYDEELLR